MAMGETVHAGNLPLVSIIMLSYNGLPYIKEAVACILAQTYTNWELIIADDGSNDGTREWLTENTANDSRIRLFLHEKNLGYVANKNFAHRQAKGEYITQLDNDDTCTPDRIAKQMGVVHQQPEIKLVGCGYYRIDFNGKVYGATAPEKDILIEKRPIEGYPFWFPSLLVHRSVFDNIGYFNEYFAGTLGDDYYWTVLANRQYPIYCLRDALYGYRNNPNSITNDYTNERKLIISGVIDFLVEQQENNGYDYLSQKNFSALEKLEMDISVNKYYMAKKLRMGAAVAIDNRQFNNALMFLKKAVILNPLNIEIYKTIFYGFRKFLSK